jgi:diguanylate cyclase (GGDEF)-like protein
MKAFCERLQHDLSLALTFSMTLVGCVFLSVFGILSWFNSNYILSVCLLTAMLFGIINIALLNTKYRYLTTPNLSIICAFICFVLLILGGKDETGLLWTFPLLMISIAILRVFQALVYSVVYIVSVAYLFSISQSVSWIVDYSEVVSSRYLFSSMALSALTLVLIKIQDNTNKLLELKNITDNLTGLYNRGVISTILGEKAARREKVTKSTLLLLDIDHFKMINDDHGHLVGDEILVHFSETLQSAIRATDFAIRWGGEEFLVILKHCELHNAYATAEKIRQSIQNHQEITSLIGKPMTVSIGLAEIDEGADINHAIKSADKELYYAKANGRNKIMPLIDTMQPAFSQ